MSSVGEQDRLQVAEALAKALISLEGRRVSVYTVYDADVEVKGEPWCQIKELRR